MALYALVAMLPAALVALGLLWLEPHSGKVRWTLTLAIACSWLTLAWVVEEVAQPLHTLANLLASLRERDFSIRGRHGRDDDALGMAMTEANLLAATLREERYGALDASALVRKVMEAIDVPIFVFAPDERLTLAKRSWRGGRRRSWGWARCSRDRRRARSA